MSDKDTIEQLNNKIQKMNEDYTKLAENSNPDALDIANEKIQEYATKNISQNQIIKDLKTEKSKLENEIDDLKGKNASLNKTMLNLKLLNNNLRKDAKKHDLEKLGLQKKHHDQLESVIKHAKKIDKQNFKDIKF